MLNILRKMKEAKESRINVAERELHEHLGLKWNDHPTQRMADRMKALDEEKNYNAGFLYERTRELVDKLNKARS